MDERNLKKGLGTILDKQNDLPQTKRNESAGAPWWLVIVLVLVLVGLGSYIAWMNSALPGNRMDFLSFFQEPRTSGTQTVAPDSLAIWEDSLLNENAFVTDSTAQGLQAIPGATVVGDTALTSVPPVSPTVNAAIPAAAPESFKPGYYIKAGEFKSRSSAQYRVSDLRQGNYPAKIIEPDSSGGTFIVSAGEFSSYNKARAQARTIGFILDIRTSVVKKE